MNKKSALLLCGILIIVILLFNSLAIAITPIKTTASKKRFELRNEVKHLAPSGQGNAKKGGPPLSVEIIYPDDGATLPVGDHTILVKANAKKGVNRVELSFDGVSWQEIPYDGTEYYFYDWTVNTEGSYTITARVTDKTGKSKQESNTVQIGEISHQKWALLIGIADYQGGSSDLWHPDEDAKDMEMELLLEGFPPENIKVLLNGEATANAISEEMDWLVASEKAGDVVVFFYSGHGHRARDRERWDGDKESDGYDEMIVTHDFYGLPDGWFEQKFAAIESTDFALMFGSCHSGGMFDDNDDLQGTGRIIAAACKADQYGWDYFLLGNTLWGHYFIDQGLLLDNAASIETAHAYAYPRVVAEQPDSQPQLDDKYPGDFGI